MANLVATTGTQERDFLEHAEIELGHLEQLLHALTKLSAHCCGDERLMNAAMADAICHAATQAVEKLANRLHEVLHEDEMEGATNG